MNQDFPCLPVKVLYRQQYYDGPLSGICEYNNEKLYFLNVEELMFKFPETDPECIKMAEDAKEEPCQYHRCRIFNIYRIPQDCMDALIYNHNLWEDIKLLTTWKEDYLKLSKKLPDTWPEDDEFLEKAWKWLIGYTTEDVWDRNFLKTNP
jgi:hypothetical protein